MCKGGGARAESRQDQKGRCSKTEQTHLTQSSCEFTCDEVEARFSWLAFFSGPWPGASVPDGCNPTHACFAEELANSRKGDIIIFLVGLHYILWRPDGIAAFGGGEEGGRAYESWLAESTASWNETLSHAWHGRREDIFRIRIPFLAYDVALATHGPNLWGVPIRDVQTRIAEMNILQDAVFSSTGWSVVDLAGISHGKEDLYVTDGVHISGMLSQIAWHVILSQICGNPLQEGVDSKTTPQMRLFG